MGRWLFAGATLLALVPSLGASTVSLVGCSSCDLEEKCTELEGSIVMDKLHEHCGAEPKGTGDTRSWTNDSGTCTCNLNLEGWSHFLRNCAFEAAK